MRLVLLAFVPAAMYAATFDALVDDFFTNAYFKFQPSNGTQAGFHQYDTQFEDYSRQTLVDDQSAALRKYEGEFQKINPSSLDPYARGDREMILGYIHAT